eukprot:681170-Amphidinium_carterae.1
MLPHIDSSRPNAERFPQEQAANLRENQLLLDTMLEGPGKRMQVLATCPSSPQLHRSCSPMLHAGHHPACDAKSQCCSKTCKRVALIRSHGVVSASGRKEETDHFKMASKHLRPA